MCPKPKECTIGVTIQKAAFQVWVVVYIFSRCGLTCWEFNILCSIKWVSEAVSRATTFHHIFSIYSEEKKKHLERKMNSAGLREKTGCGMLLKTTKRNSQSGIVGNLSFVRWPAFHQGVDDQKEDDCKMLHTRGTEERTELSETDSGNCS